MKSYLNTYKNYWDSLLTQKKLSTLHYVVLSGVSLLLTIWVSFDGTPKKSTSNALASQVMESIPVSTMIPKGYSLTPIEILNSDKLDQLIGKYATVDIYKKKLNSSKPFSLVATQVPLLRSQGIRNNFSVLTRAEEAYRFLGNHQIFSVVVRAPSKVGTKFVTSKKRKRLIITENI